MLEQDWLASTDPAAMLAFIGSRVSDRKLRLFACACCRQVWHLLTDDAECERCEGKGYWHPNPIHSRGCAYCKGTGRVNRSRLAVEVAEWYADGKVSWDERAKACRAADRLVTNDSVAQDMAVFACHQPDPTFQPLPSSAYEQEEWQAPFAALLREVIGNPCRPVTSLWAEFGGPMGTEKLPGPLLTTTVVSLAQAAYEDRPVRMCERCGGTGEVDRVEEAGGYDERGPIVFGDPIVDCPDCHGTGRIDDGALCNDRFKVLADALTDAGCDHTELLEHLRSPGSHVRGCWALDTTLGRS